MPIWCWYATKSVSTRQKKWIWGNCPPEIAKTTGIVSENFPPQACQQRWVPPGDYLEPSRRDKSREMCRLPASLCYSPQNRPSEFFCFAQKEKLRRGAFWSPSEPRKISQSLSSFWKFLKHLLGLMGLKSALGGWAAQWLASLRCLGSGIYVLKDHFSRRNAVDTLSCRLFLGEPLLMENNRLIVLKRLFNK